MLCCIVLYCVVSYRAPGCGCPCVRSEMKSRIDSISYLYDGRKLFLMAETAQGAKMLFVDGWNAPGAKNGSLMTEADQKAKMLFFDC